ncbi:hypothetical protein M378DRAFT_510643 [Amanita muscaria Koide BX008]|uniref:Small EDRK-rich factor-like N-terminal domain-containing protein n=1 Tax=Amanita muscaria (strain Koide BX008) TaxID=946122 RepID=A0A0C2XNE2_AMAMK|nr:hypothetical protein M378DRAFT_510643 [Amanita muscaria Koide BX008]
MTRGNQRDQDRLKAQKKAAASQKKPKESASSLAKRKEADAEILRAKQKVRALPWSMPRKEHRRATGIFTFRKKKNRKLQGVTVVNDLCGRKHLFFTCSGRNVAIKYIKYIPRHDRCHLAGHLNLLSFTSYLTHV